MEFSNVSAADRILYKVDFSAEYSWFEFRVFILLDWFPNQDSRIQSTRLFIHSWGVWGKNKWIHAFTKNISEKWKNSNSLWTWVADFIPFDENIHIQRISNIIM